MTKRLTGSIVCTGILALASVVFAQRPARQGAAPAAPTAAKEMKPAPRTADGQPDLSGVWSGGGSGGTGDEDTGLAGEHGSKGGMELTKWGQDKFNWNRGPESANAIGVYRGQHARVDQDPLYHCYPAGLVRLGPPSHFISGGGGLYEIVQRHDKILMLFQYQHEVRTIYIDGREHPKNLELTWNGHSIGKWDGDTLVVDTVGFRDESWLDSGGHEHSKQLHVVERFRRSNLNSLEIERTIDDPVALTKPLTTRAVLKLSPDRDLDENIGYDCTQFMVRKPYFGEGEGGLLGISEPPSEPAQ